MVHIIFDTSSVALNDFAQFGGGADITFFKGLPPYHQRGAGLGDILRGIWRVLLPMLKSAGKSAGEEVLSTGTRVLDKLVHGDSGIKETLISEGKRGVDNLLEKGGVSRQFGTGIKRRRINKQSTIPNIKSLIGKKVILPKKRRNRSDAFGLY